MNQKSVKRKSATGLILTYSSDIGDIEILDCRNSCIYENPGFYPTYNNKPLSPRAMKVGHGTGIDAARAAYRDMCGCV